MSNDPALHPVRAAADLSIVAADERSHLVQFYDSASRLAEAAASFLAPGVASGDGVVIVATPGHAALILSGLRAKAVDVDGARAAGMLLVLDADEVLERISLGDMPQWDLFEREIGGVLARLIGASRNGRARAYGEMVDVLWRAGRRSAAIALEGLWERMARKCPFSLLCAYAMGNFFRESDSGDFLHVCDLHDAVAPVGDQQHVAQPGALREMARLQQRALALEAELLHRKELEEALRCAREQAEAASRAKDEFLAMLGHELRNPLSPILTAVELMRLRGGGRLGREQEVIERQTRHLSRLVDDLLDVSRVTRGMLQLRRAVVDVREVVEKAVEMARPLLDARDHRLEVHAPPPGALRIDGDEARLSQVIANLLTNAAKYTPQGGRITVTVRTEGADVAIEVRDNGVGIGPELLPRVFDLFVQGRQAADRAQGGLGIGLALVRSLVQLHGGSVHAHSEGPGRGSVFTVRLPAPSQVGSDATSAGDEAGTGAVASRRVLLVDDNEDAVSMLAELVRAAGHDVRTACDGPSALDVARTFRPDVAVLDIGLPGMDGYDLARRLRASIDGPITVFALSGYGQETDRARSAAAGFARHLVKPLDSGALLEAIEAS